MGRQARKPGSTANSRAPVIAGLSRKHRCFTAYYPCALINSPKSDPTHGFGFSSPSLSYTYLNFNRLLKCYVYCTIKRVALDV